MEHLTCICGYVESEKMPFTGFFSFGNSFSTSDSIGCCLFGCPKCGTVKYVTDKNYIRKRKDEYKRGQKSRRKTND